MKIFFSKFVYLKTIKLSVTKCENTRLYIYYIQTKRNNSISHNSLWNCVTLRSIFLDDLENHTELSKVVWQSVPNCQLPKLSRVRKNYKIFTLRLQIILFKSSISADFSINSELESVKSSLLLALSNLWMTVYYIIILVTKKAPLLNLIFKQAMPTFI